MDLVQYQFPHLHIVRHAFEHDVSAAGVPSVEALVAKLRGGADAVVDGVEAGSPDDVLLSAVARDCGDEATGKPWEDNACPLADAAPPVVRSQEWDAIIVDGPASFAAESTGRLVPLYVATKLARDVASR